MTREVRITISLPSELVRRVDRVAGDRNRFIATAVRHELDRRNRAALLESLEHPHPETALAETGLADWAASLPEGDDQLIDVNAGTPVEWVPGRGWIRRT